ncbi:site-specific integrase [Chromobacterium sp. Beijing]|nr:site-specific integrase [Chromobacterium sp. Beijing]
MPDLTFPVVKYGELETPWDLRPLLYCGGAGSKVNLVAQQIAKDLLGVAINDRIPLVQKLHEYINGKLVSGGSRGSASTSIRRLREFFSWADMTGKLMSLESVEGTYIDWTDHLLHRQRVDGDISEIHAYQSAVAVAKILDSVLELKTGLLVKTRIRCPSHIKSIISPKADKQNIEATFSFGHALLDITEALSTEVIRGALPVTIKFRTGHVIEEWLKLKPTDKVQTLGNAVKPSVRRVAIKKRTRWESDTSVRTRHPLINLRIESEMLIFIAQTGINFEQAHALKMSKFRYQSYLDGYQIFRVYKGRRSGEVAFEIFSQYREHFERYLKWRATMFSDGDADLLFPLVRAGRADRLPSFGMVNKFCKKLDIRFIPPRELRKTRINWLLRRSQDIEMTAEMHAHSQQTLIRIYEQPSLQVAMVEISRFHARTDPAIASPGPGVCVQAVPHILLDAPPEATNPDCISPAGCLFCVHQRDIDSEDYIWSLASYRYLKVLEVTHYRVPLNNHTPHPAEAVINRITAKLKYFEQSSEVRALWVREAVTRVEEDNHHPRWEGFIRLMEMRRCL